MTGDDHGTAMRPQEAFEELARVTLADHSVDTVMAKIADLAKRTVPGAHEVSVTLVQDSHPRTVAFTGALAAELDQRQYERGYGPCLRSIEGSEPVVIRSMSGKQRWPDFAREAASQGVGSSLSIPVPLQREVAAALNIYSTDEQAFDEAGVELEAPSPPTPASRWRTCTCTRRRASSQSTLQIAMHSRAVIEQAKGILMGQRRCTSEQAFDILVGLSQAPSRKLRDVAQALVDDTVLGA